MPIPAARVAANPTPPTTAAIMGVRLVEGEVEAGTVDAMLVSDGLGEGVNELLWGSSDRVVPEEGVDRDHDVLDDELLFAVIALLLLSVLALLVSAPLVPDITVGVATIEEEVVDKGDSVVVRSVVDGIVTMAVVVV